MSQLPVVAKRLKEARLIFGISQKALGIAAGLDQFSASARINQYERGKHIPDIYTAGRLAETLKIPMSFLFEENDDLAELIVKFSRLDETEKTLLLKSIT